MAKKQPKRAATIAPASPAYAIAATEPQLRDLTCLLEIASRNAFVVPTPQGDFRVPLAVADWLLLIDQARSNVVSPLKQEEAGDG